MQNSQGNQEDDLAIVYNKELGPIQNDTEFQIVTFPEIVTLSTSIGENYYDASFEHTDPLPSSIEHANASMMLTGNSCEFYYSLYSSSEGNDSINVRYTSEDGIHYTRTQFTHNNVPVEEDNIDLGIKLKYKANEWSQWDDSMGQFILSLMSYFGGLFQYTDNQYRVASSQLDASSDTVYNKYFLGKNGVDFGSLQLNTNLNAEQIKFRRELRNIYSTFTVNSLYRFFYGYNLYLQNNSTYFDVSDLNVLNLDNTSYMFGNCYNINDGISLNTSEVKDMSGMFFYCTNLNSSLYTNIANYNTDNVTNMSALYRLCTNLKLVPNHNTSKVIDMSHMFGGCINLTNIPTYDTSSVINMANMFQRCTNLNLNRITTLNTDNVTDVTSMFSNCETTTYVPNFNTAKVTNMTNFCGACYNLTTVPNFNTTNVEDMGGMFSYCYNLVNVPPFDTSNVIDMNNMFQKCNKLNISSLATLNTSNLTNAFAMFEGVNTIRNTDFLSALDLSNVVNAGRLLYADKNLVYVNNTFNLSNAKVMKEIFGACDKLISVQNFDTSNVVDMSQMFSYSFNITTVPNFDTSNVTNMYGMFSKDEKITNIPNYNTQKVTNMAYMFADCYALTSVPNFNTINVTDMTNMFERAIVLVDVPNFDTSNVTDMTRMFGLCRQLKNIPNFDTSNVVNMQGTFEYCNNLVNAPNLNTSKVVSMSSMFYNCYNLINVPQYNTSNIKYMSSMFYICNNLSDASIQNIINMCLNSNITNNWYMNLNTQNSYGPLYGTNITNTKYQARWSELTAAGWNY